MKTFFHAGWVAMAGRALGLLANVLLARMLGVAGYGTYSFALTLSSLITVPAESGFATLLTREVALRRARSPDAGLGALVIPFLALIASTVGFALLLFALMLPLLSSQFAAFDSRLTLLLAAAIPVLAIRSSIGGIARGLGRVIQAVLPKQIANPGLFVVILLVFPVGGAVQAFGIQLACMFASMVLALLLLWRIWPRAVQREQDDNVSKSAMLRASVPFGLISLFYLINQRVDIIILGAFEGAEVLGIYSVAAQLALLAAMPLEILNGIIAPRIVAMNAANDRDGLARLMLRSSMGMALIATGGIGLFFLIGEFLLETVFGPEFVAAFPLALILLGGQFINLSCGPVGTFLNLCGAERHTLQGLALSAVTAIAANLILVPIYGAYGAAFSTVIGIAFWNVYLSHRLYKAAGIPPGLFGLFATRRA